MKIFCPTCGSDNTGLPGTRITCRACTATFTAPAESGWVAPSAPPPAPVAEPPRPAMQPPTPVQLPVTGYQGPPPSGFGRGESGLPINPLALVSFVLGILCCIPFSGVAAIITGVIARQQIAASNGTQRGNEYATIGMVLGVLAVVVTMASVVLSALKPH